MATVPGVTAHTRLKINKIAVLSGFSKNADIALRFAARFARAYKANIVLAHAYMPPSSAFAAPEIELTYEALDHCRQRLRDSLLRQTEASYLRDIEYTVVLREGAPRELLEDLRDVDLIVVGTSGETGLRKAALGSTAEAIFRSSGIPVLTIGPRCRCSGTEELTPNTILYATDFSPGARAALSYALSIIDREHDAKLVLLHVADRKDVPFSFDRTMASAEPLEKLHHLAADGIAMKHEPTYVIGFGTPDTVIIEEAKRHKADLIVIGARGSGGFASAVSHFSGGTAYKVAATAGCPVLTIRKG